jgi:mono/diheme cytochrome c family protein
VRILSQAAAAALLLAPLPALAQEAGNPSRGHDYARAHCAECHGVETSRDDFSPDADAPDFAVVANTPGMTERAVGVWLQTSHPNMPNLMIAPADRDDLAAYIMSLRKEGVRP